MPTYPIVEIFHSVQGEAFHTGVPHVFIRFGNCNLRCEWCDTDFLTFEDLELEDIVNQKMPDLTAANIDSAIRTLAGSARSAGLEVEGVD